MNLSKIGCAALMLIGGLAGPALAQQKSASIGEFGSYPASQVDGTGRGYYAPYPGEINYGLSGTFPRYGGYGYQGFGPGAQFGAHYPSKLGVDAPNKAAPPSPSFSKSSSDPGGLSDAIRRATGRTKGHPPTRKKP